MPGERRLIVESPQMHHSERMQSYILQEVVRPCKQWIHEVLGATREVERVKLRTNDFVLLPDVDTLNKRVCSRLLIDRPDDCFERNTKHDYYFNTNYNAIIEYRQTNYTKSRKNITLSDPINPSSHMYSEKTHMYSEKRWRTKRIPSLLHWLAVVNDTELRTIRDLRGKHIPLLETLNILSCKKIHEETGIEPDQIMSYVHYPPSVYQLHIHFKHPIGPHVSHDTFRIHSLSSIINNLKIDSEYYAKSLLQVPVYQNTELYNALCIDDTHEMSHFNRFEEI